MADDKELEMLRAEILAAQVWICAATSVLSASTPYVAEQIKVRADDLVDRSPLPAGIRPESIHSALDQWHRVLEEALTSPTL